MRVENIQQYGQARTKQLHGQVAVITGRNLIALAE